MKEVLKRKLVILLAFLTAITYLPETVYAAGVGVDTTEDRSNNVADNHLDICAVAKFTFDDEINGFQSNGIVAERKGEGGSLQTDAVHGKALLLDGQSYLSVKDEEGRSPLNGLEELTISYFSKPANRENQIYWGWTVYAAPDDSIQKVYYERYIGVRDLRKGISVERFCNNGRRPDTGSGTETVDRIDWKGQDVGWKHVAIVFRKEQTDLYINGKLAVEEKANYALEDILGNDGIFQIGKANWNTIGEGEFYTGYLDEYAIFDHALTAEEIKTLSQKPGDVSSDTDIDVDIGDGEKPNPENPDPENPNPENPNPENPDPENPNPEDPDPENPSPENPDPEKPNPENPNPENPDSEKPSPENPDPENPAPDNGNNQQPAISLTLPYTAVTIPKGKTLSIKAKVIPSNTPLTWKTSNASVVKVKNGKITGRKSGKATISVQTGSVRARCKVTVADVSWNVKSAVFQAGTSSSALQIGKRYPQKDKVKAYKSSNPKIVKINQKGKITAGKKPGKAVLTVIMASGASASCKITVQKKAVRIQKISLNEKKLILRRGGRVRLNAIRKPVTATGKIIWASSNRRVATVDKNGIVKARKKGKAKIIAKTSNGKKAVCSVAVK